MGRQLQNVENHWLRTFNDDNLVPVVQKDIRAGNTALEAPLQIFLTLTLISMGIIEPPSKYQGSYVLLDLGKEQE